MSHDEMTRDPFFVRPDNKVGKLIHRIAELPYARPGALIWMIASIGGFISVSPSGPSALVAGLVGLSVSVIGAMAVQDASTKELCPDCGYQQSERNRYCAACGDSLEVSDS